MLPLPNDQFQELRADSFNARKTKFWCLIIHNNYIMIYKLLVIIHLIFIITIICSTYIVCDYNISLMQVVYTKC